MKGVPPELDRLMWAVAETSGPQAIEEFCARHPQHRGELMRRVNMVQGLRSQVKVSAHGRTEPPRFVPREPIQAPNPRGLFLAGTLGLAALAAASFTAYSAFHPVHRQVVPKVVDVRPLPDAPLAVPKIVEKVPESLTVPPAEAGPSPSSQPIVPSYLQRREKIEVKDGGLVDALTLVTAGTGMKLEIGPGFVDQRVSIEYHDLSPLEAVQAMAKEYAFSVFDEGDGNFLVVPVADDNSKGPNQRPVMRVKP